MVLHLKGAFLGDFLQHSVQVKTNLDTLDRAAGLTHNMMVMTVVGDKFVTLHAVEKIDFRDSSLLHEKVEFTIDARFVRGDPGRFRGSAKISYRERPSGMLKS
jgi:hypothetical protein